jgi:beta-phosphoglucomutase-like phosphatase (HAD superfamily)
VLAAAGLTDRFRVTVSSEEVPRGKPAPDVYLAAATKLAAEPAACVAVEDSANGLRAAAAAAMVVVAVSNPHFPPPADVLALARATVPTPAGLTPELIRAL